MSDRINSLEQQVNALWDHINALRGGQSPYQMHSALAQAESHAPYNSNENNDNLPPNQSRAGQSQFSAPTSSAFNLDVAKSSLQTMGITPQSDLDSSGKGAIDPALASHTTRHGPVAPTASMPRQEAL